MKKFIKNLWKALDSSINLFWANIFNHTKEDLTRLEINTFITVSKLKSKNDNTYNPTVLDERYTVEGFLLKPIKIGDNLLLERTNINGVEQLGSFTSSKIVDIQGNIVQTANSYWKIEPHLHFKIK